MYDAGDHTSHACVIMGYIGLYGTVVGGPPTQFTVNTSANLIISQLAHNVDLLTDWNVVLSALSGV